MANRKITSAIDRRELLAGAAAVSGSLLLPRAALAQSTPRRGGILRWAIPFNPSSVDPMTGRTAGEFACLYPVFDTLIDFNPSDLALKPGLAKAWNFDTPTAFTLDLVEGATFHDGAPFDAEAVKFNLDRYRSDPRSNVKADLATVTAVEVTGKYRVTLRLDRPNAALPATLTDRAGMMVSPKHIKEKGPNVDRAPVGTGPWKFVSLADNDRFIVTRNENYWRLGLPYLDGLNIAIITEPTTSLRSLIAGENDLATTLGTQQKSVLDRNPSLITSATSVLSMSGIYLNYGRPPLDDIRIRQALNYAVDRVSLSKTVALGLDIPTSAIIPKAHWAGDPATADFYQHDPDKARKLLADAGHPGGIDIPMYGWSDQVSMQRQEVVVTQLAKSGIRIQLTPASPAQSSGEFFGAKKGAGRMALIAARPDPSQEYDNLFSKSAYFNAGGVELPGYRELLDATLATTDRAARKEAFAKLQRFQVENALAVPLMFNTSVASHHPKVKNFVSGIIDKPRATEVWLDA